MSRMISVVFIALIILSSGFKHKPPKNGLILQIGGVVSPWRAYVVDFDSGTIRFYKADWNKGPETGKLAGSRKLDPKIISDIRTLADQAIAADYSSPEGPSADFNASLGVSKQGKITVTNTFGPVIDKKQPISSLLNLLIEQFHE